MRTPFRTACQAALAVLAAALSAGCGDEPAGPPQPPAVALELGLDAAPNVNQPLALAADLKPTFSEGSLHAWLLAAVFGAASKRDVARLEVYDLEGTRTDIQRPFRADDGHVWVLRHSERGAAQLVLVDPKEPFREFPGSGGTRGRPGDPPQRVRSVTRLRLVFGKSEPPEPPTPEDAKVQLGLQLTVTIDGEDRNLSAEVLAKVTAVKVGGDNGKEARDAWAVRALVTAVGGEAARLTEVKGRGARALVIHTDSWADATKVPLLRLNRRGQFKFFWADEDLKPSSDPDMRDVKVLVIVTK
jgi:hypothetical protein